MNVEFAQQKLNTLWGLLLFVKAPRWTYPCVWRAVKAKMCQTIHSSAFLLCTPKCEAWSPFSLHSLQDLAEGEWGELASTAIVKWIPKCVTGLTLWTPGKETSGERQQPNTTPRIWKILRSCVNKTPIESHSCKIFLLATKYTKKITQKITFCWFIRLVSVLLIPTQLLTLFQIPVYMWKKNNRVP